MLQRFWRLRTLCVASRMCLKKPFLSRISTSPIWYHKRGKRDGDNVSQLFIPLPVKQNSEEINIGADLTGPLNKADLLKILNLFYQEKNIKLQLSENGLDNYLQHQVYVSFRKFCLEENTLPTDLHVVVSDILQGARNVTDILPYFLRHAREMYPHLVCMDELKRISDLRTPANWYPQARSINRKIIFHAGPTNSGKTYHALERFITAKSGIYCGPLKLLATEVFNKTNSRGTPCDLRTGEERLFADPMKDPSAHVACTVEMAGLNNPYEVAVIDEIQMVKDQQRGWAWTRALLGLIAEEIHVCGEPGAVDLVRELCFTTDEDVEVRNYKRLTQLTVEDAALGSLDNVMPGDCIVCFSKNDIYSVSRDIEASGRDVAVIYGGLPPGTKLAQAAKFNDPDNSCKILVATDAIGMGLNLSIRRVIFYSLIKPTMNEKGEREMDTISVSSALQIAGRAGRYGTQWEQGFVTTYKPEDLKTLKRLLESTPEPITKAGLHPTFEQVELYSFHLPKSGLSNLMDIFVNLSTVDDSRYFMCNMEDFKFLADMIQHVELPLSARYIFCCAPINKKMPFVCTMFLKFARQYNKNERITFDWICRNIGWPMQPPKTIIDLVHLEAVFDVLDLYLWLSYRFTDLFTDANLIRDMQKELDAIIQQGVIQLTRLLRNSETSVSSGAASLDEDQFSIKSQKQSYLREPRSPGIGGRRLTERLLAQGILTPSMLDALKKEWNKIEVDDDDGDEPPKKLKRKRKIK